jgi:hypothetical protein
MWSGADAAKPRLVRRRNAKAEGGLQGAPFASRGGLPLRWSDGDVSVVHAGADDVWQVTAPDSGQVCQRDESVSVIVDKPAFYPE